ncbi:hypothetical protein D3C84_1190470 [compost metagenome]
MRLGQVAVDVGAAHDLLAGTQRWPDVEQAEQPVVTGKRLRRAFLVVIRHLLDGLAVGGHDLLAIGGHQVMTKMHRQ